MSLKLLVPKGAVAWGVWKGLIHFPDHIMSDEEINNLFLNRARRKYKQKDQHGPANPSQPVSQCEPIDHPGQH